MDIPYPAILAVYNQVSSWIVVMIKSMSMIMIMTTIKMIQKKYVKYAINFVTSYGNGGSIFSAMMAYVPRMEVTQVAPVSSILSVVMPWVQDFCLFASRGTLQPLHNSALLPVQLFQQTCPHPAQTRE